MMHRTYPRIHLAIDSCFASKRWADPVGWAEIVRDAGVRYVEVSADCDLDPLYSAPGVYARRVERLRETMERYSLTASSFYSGHGTYSMTGFGSPDAAQRQYLIDRWLTPYAHSAGEMDAGIGWYFQAIGEDILDDPVQYGEAREWIAAACRESADAARDAGCSFAAVEQMYSPGQIPWTIEDCRAFIRKTGIYTTLDCGHQTGQRHFLKPNLADLEEALETDRIPYVGSSEAMRLCRQARETKNSGKRASLLQRVEEDMERHPYLFARVEDGDLSRWVEELGCYSPVIHLQQTDGSSSAHHPFTEEYNRNGVVEPVRLLNAIKTAYDRLAHPDAADSGMPEPCGDIYLTLELFFPLTTPAGKIREDIAASVRWWRDSVPRDGMTLDQLVQTNT